MCVLGQSQSYLRSRDRYSSKPIQLLHPKGRIFSRENTLLFATALIYTPTNSMVTYNRVCHRCKVAAYTVNQSGTQTFLCGAC
ncbi:protein of unknown function [Agrobacterium pusense]|uniref:Uncharacterized protein n=1 Tax=Agrobacterium pusense TaxID=648995 RepID=U4QCU7_9HYPH|nr:protein of unknown function [Agrobacterium pusense]